ncbi:uncharacterized protein DEA37_0003056 [Paragonimus westermani]|uniref:Cyclin N-terminal domain-containing protein n=1 Tax=Paragonimus westermani TaxID=34504 RepID=A0A5J4NPU9_9TREM|nr:uncharacterized protein DEA37_0003056 [Paragonimus westermani]
MMVTGSRNVVRVLGASGTELPKALLSVGCSKKGRRYKKRSTSSEFQRQADQIPPNFLLSVPFQLKDDKGQSDSARTDVLDSSCNLLNTDLKSVADDKLDSSLRKETLGRLWCLHSAYYNLSSLVFCKAVCLMDLFIAKVKVKPKYAMCAAAACYYIASKFERTADVLLPTPDSLVMLSRCGGSAVDFTRMVEIILSKLTPTLVASVGGCSATALDFLKVFALVTVNKTNSAHQLPFDPFNPAYSSVAPNTARLSPFLCRQLEVALTSTEAASFRPSCLALALLSLYCVPNNKASTIELDENLCCNGPDLFNLAQLCGVHWSEVETCKMAIQDTLGTPRDAATFQDYPSSRLLGSSPPLVWTLSRRTQRSISTSSPPSLPTIDELEEDTNLLSSRLSILELSTAPKTTHTTCAGSTSRPSRS